MTAFVTPVVEYWLEREIAQWIHPMKDRSINPSHHERTLFPRSYISLHYCNGVMVYLSISVILTSLPKMPGITPFVFWSSYHERTLLPWSYISLHYCNGVMVYLSISVLLTSLPKMPGITPFVFWSSYHERTLLPWSYISLHYCNGVMVYLSISVILTSLPKMPGITPFVFWSSYHERTLLPRSYISLHYCNGVSVDFCDTHQSSEDAWNHALCFLIIVPWANALTTELHFTPLL